jgi:hypothetical protein
MASVYVAEDRTCRLFALPNGFAGFWLGVWRPCAAVKNELRDWL